MGRSAGPRGSGSAVGNLEGRSRRDRRHYDRPPSGPAPERGPVLDRETGKSPRRASVSAPAGGVSARFRRHRRHPGGTVEHYEPTARANGSAEPRANAERRARAERKKNRRGWAPNASAPHVPRHDRTAFAGCPPPSLSLPRPNIGCYPMLGSWTKRLRKSELRGGEDPMPHILSCIPAMVGHCQAAPPPCVGDSVWALAPPAATSRRELRPEARSPRHGAPR